MIFLGARAPAQVVETRSCEIRLENSWTLADVRAAVNRLADMGINCVRVETFYHGSTIYTSPVMLRNGFPAIRSGFGPGPNALRTVIDAAHARGMTVYAWVETFYVWNTALGSGYGPILNKHPEWSIRNADGTMLCRNAESAYYYISPANLEARAFLKDLYGEIANTGVDGMFVDYLRYPRGALGPSDPLSFDDASRQRALSELGLDISQIPLIASNADFKTWTLWRQQQTTDAARELAAAVRAANPNVVFCGSLHPGYNADWRTHDSLRDWPAWQPDVPAFSMQYYTSGAPPSSGDVLSQESQMDADLAAASPRSLLWPDVKESDILYGMPLLNYARSQPFAGVSYWVYSALSAADGAALFAGPFHEPSLQGETMPVRAARLLLTGALSTLSESARGAAESALALLSGPRIEAAQASALLSSLLAGSLPAGTRRDVGLAYRLLNLAPATRIRGDVDGDGFVTAADAVRIARWTLTVAPAISRDAADANDDGGVSPADAAAALRIAAGL
ncbi:MAG TPA: family 10 glycosylhydrolase [Armatimonadota bacterium]